MLALWNYLADTVSQKGSAIVSYLESLDAITGIQSSCEDSRCGRA
jgi:hypothetical protein